MKLTAEQRAQSYDATPLSMREMGFMSDAEIVAEEKQRKAAKAEHFEKWVRSCRREGDRLDANPLPF